MEEQSKQTSSEDVEAHHRSNANHHPNTLAEEPGTPDEQGRRNVNEDDDVEAHIRAGRNHHPNALVEDEESTDEHGRRN
jgi:hypothetical protein